MDDGPLGVRLVEEAGVPTGSLELMLAERRLVGEQGTPEAGLREAAAVVRRLGERLTSARVLVAASGAETARGRVWLVRDEDGGLGVPWLDLEPPTGGTGLAGLVAGLARALDDLARRDGLAPVRVSAWPGDPMAEALRAGGAWGRFRVTASQMILPLDGAPPSDGATAALRPMTDDDYAAWEEQEVEAYAADLVGTGLTPAAALERSRADHASLLPLGLRTPGQEFWVAEVGGARVGTLWLGGERPLAFVYDVVVDEGARGRGHGAAVMRAAEAWARERGRHAVGLNVFGDNVVARRLYDRLGYRLVEDLLVLEVGRP